VLVGAGQKELTLNQRVVGSSPTAPTSLREVSEGGRAEAPAGEGGRL
jgi:hypothetical protein